MNKKRAACPDVMPLYDSPVNVIKRGKTKINDDRKVLQRTQEHIQKKKKTNEKKKTLKSIYCILRKKKD